MRRCPSHVHHLLHRFQQIAGQIDGQKCCPHDHAVPDNIVPRAIRRTAQAVVGVVAFLDLVHNGNQLAGSDKIYGLLVRVCQPHEKCPADVQIDIAGFALNLILNSVFEVQAADVRNGVAVVCGVYHIFPLLFLDPEHRHNLCFAPRFREPFQRVDFRICADVELCFKIVRSMHPVQAAGATVFDYFGNRCNFHVRTSPMD